MIEITEIVDSAIRCEPIAGNAFSVSKRLHYSCMANIFLLRENDQIIEMEERCYDSERVLQELLSKYPSILGGERLTGGKPLRWLLVQAEAGLSDRERGSNRWSVDHLFVDHEGVPTIVEVKRSCDTRIRREVVGQMLEYAANAVPYWNADTLRGKFAETCRVSGLDPEETLLAFLGRESLVDEGAITDSFWQIVSENLQTGKLRLIFVADEIPNELRRIVEFLNDQMKSTEVLAIEVKQFVGAGAKTLVPRLIGQTTKAEATKFASAKLRPQRQWDEASFLDALETNKGCATADIARKIIEWSGTHMTDIWWGNGGRDGSCFLGLRGKDKILYACSLWTYGSVEIQFQSLQRRPPFDDIALRLELAKRLNGIAGVEIPMEAVTRRPVFQIDALLADGALDAFFGTLSWFAGQVQSHSSASASAL